MVRFLLCLGLALFTLNAHAAIDNAGILDDVLNRYATTAGTWAATITSHATWLFWTLALISMVWTFGMLALRKADIGEFFAEFIRFTVFTGFFWWLLANGPYFATSIMDSLRTIGGNATGTGATLTPSGIVDIGFDIFFKVLDQSTVWSPVDSATGIVISAAVLIILALIGVNMLLLLVSGWILAYAGIFFLGFGGSRWTSDMAIGYFKTVLSVAAQLFTMVLLVGIGKAFIDQYYTQMSAGISLKELAVMLIVAVVLLSLVSKVPALIGQLAMGGGTHALGTGFGAGAAVGAAAMGAAAAATAGAAMAAAATSMAGGAHAVMAAFSKANAAENAGHGAANLLAAIGGAESYAGAGFNTGNALASAMGDQAGGRAFTGGGQDSRGASAGSDAKGKTAQDGSGNQKSGGMAAAAAQVGKVAAGTVANLAQGTLDVATAKAVSMKAAAMDHMAETTGGQIAAAISGQGGSNATDRPFSQPPSAPIFGENSLAPADADSEVMAFRDRDNRRL